MAETHKCTTDGPCCCYQWGDEPNYRCPRHGFYAGNRCTICGRFMRVVQVQEPANG
jgi:hypothetical protein